MRTEVFSKGGEVFPFLEVFRAVETDLLLASKRHQPCLRFLVPHHFGVTEIGYIAHQHGISFVFGEGISAVGAVRDRLMLTDHFGLRINRHNSVLAKAGSVFAVNNDRAGEDCTQ